MSKEIVFEEFGTIIEAEMLGSMKLDKIIIKKYTKTPFTGGIEVQCVEIPSNVMKSIYEWVKNEKAINESFLDG